MNRFRRSVYNVVTACTLVAMVVFTSLSLVTRPVGAATAPPELSLNVLLIGSGATDPTTAAWESALTNEGVAYTEVTAAGTATGTTRGPAPKAAAAPFRGEPVCPTPHHSTWRRTHC